MVAMDEVGGTDGGKAILEVMVGVDADSVNTFGDSGAGAGVSLGVTFGDGGVSELATRHIRGNTASFKGEAEGADVGGAAPGVKGEAAGWSEADSGVQTLMLVEGKRVW